MKKTAIITVLSILISVYGSVAQAASVTDRGFACEGLAAHQVELEKSLTFAVKQEFKDEKVLVDFGGNMAYMTPQQSVAYYSERIRHAKNLKKILDCQQGKGQFGEPQKVSLLK